MNCYGAFESSFLNIRKTIVTVIKDSNPIVIDEASVNIGGFPVEAMLLERINIAVFVT